MRAPPIADPAVAAVFAGYPDGVRERLLELREMIHAAAAGPLSESLKWGQPSYRAADGKTGTAVRVDALKGSADGYAVYVHCQTSLVDTYRDLYGDRLRFDGNRAVLLSASEPTPRDALAHCIALALSYRGRK